jgi:dipeptidyl aminopeptidase/acylaminoacyl peptidase
MTVTMTTDTTPATNGLDSPTAASAPPKSAIEHKPLTPEEIVDRPQPNDPQISPDGRHVLFTVAPCSKKGEHKDQAIWISHDGAPGEAFTAGTANDHSPRWSPDGTRILFVSDRAERGESKLYLISTAGGEARALGDLKGNLSSPRFSPDGKSVAVLRPDPETPEEKKRKEDKDDPIVVDEDLKRVRLWVVDVAAGKANCLTYGERNVWSYAWSPDSQRLAFLTTGSPEINTIFDKGELWTVAATGGLSRHVATFGSLVGDPVYVATDQGLQIAVKGSVHRDDPVYSVWTVPADGGEPRNILPGYEGQVDELVARGSALAVRMVERTHGLSYGLDAASGELKPLTPTSIAWKGSIQGGPTFSADGSQMAFVWSDGSTPEEVFIGGVSGTDATRVTELGKEFKDRLAPVEIVRWKSTDGMEIEGVLTYPIGYTKGTRYPLVVEIHGGPSWQWEERVMLDWHDWAQYLASHGYAVLQPNPRGSTAYGAAFQKALQDDVGGGEAQDLISGAQAMVERGIADGERLGIGGWSWGGYLTARTVTVTNIFKAAVMGAGLSNIVSDHGQDDIPNANLLYFPGQLYDAMDAYWAASPIREIARCTTPTLILHGDNDARVHPAQGMEFHRALRTLGVPTRFVRYPREGHGIGERAHQLDLLRRLLDWYDRFLKPDGEGSKGLTFG